MNAYFYGRLEPAEVNELRAPIAATNTRPAESAAVCKSPLDPARLDREADAWLAVGRHIQAERLSALAAELREAAQ